MQFIIFLTYYYFSCFGWLIGYPNQLFDFCITKIYCKKSQSNNHDPKKELGGATRIRLIEENRSQAEMQCNLIQ